MSSPQNASNRTAILADLGLAMRRSGTQGSLLSNAVAARIGISPNDFECLDIVNLEGAVTPGHLAEATGLTTGAITGVIDRSGQSLHIGGGFDESQAVAKPLHCGTRDRHRTLERIHRCLARDVVADGREQAAC